MDNKQRITYTKNCLEFLHYKCVTPDDKDFRIYQGKHNNLPEMIDANFNDEFLNNWNWIMEVKNHIIGLGYCWFQFPDTIQINENFTISSKSICKVRFDKLQEKEAVVEAINQFLIWYEQNK